MNTIISTNRRGKGVSFLLSALGGAHFVATAIGRVALVAAVAICATLTANAATAFETQSDDAGAYTFGTPLVSGETQKSNIGSESAPNTGRFAFRAGTVNIKDGGYVRVSSYVSSGDEKTWGNWIGASGKSATLNICGGTFWADKNGKSTTGAGLIRLGVNTRGALNGVATINLSSGLLKANVLKCGGSEYNAADARDSNAEMNMSGGTADLYIFQLGASRQGSYSTAAFNLTGGEMQIENYFELCAYHNQTFNWGSGKIVAEKAGIFKETDLQGGCTRSVVVSGSPAVFDTGNYAQTVPASIAGASGTGTLKLTGGNTVTLSTSPSYSLWLDDGTTLAISDLTVPANGSFTFSGDATVDGSLTLGSGAVIVCNVDDLLPSSSCTLTVNGGIVLSDGGSVLDSVIVSGAGAADCAKSISGDAITVEKSGDPDYVWNGSGTNWGDADAWDNSGSTTAWSDNNNAIFSTANAMATLTENVTANALSFTQSATIAGSSTLTVPTVSVASGVSVVISAPTAGALEKTGAGTLTLGSSRTTATTVTEGTLKMLSGATVSTQSSGAADLTLGTSDPTKRVVFDYGGQTLSATPDSYLVTGANVTLTNGTFRAGGNNNSMQLRDTTSIPAVLTIAKDATLSKYGTSGGNLVLLKTNDVATINIAGGEVHSGKYGYIQHAAETGTLNINVTEGGRLSIADNLHALCDGTAGASPSLNMMFAGSTFDAGANFHFGNATSAAFPVSPSGMFAATNSAVNVATGFYIGRNTQDEKTAGFYKADFENCAVTTRYFAVYHDRPLNNARFNGTTLTFSNAGSIAASDGAANWITVGPNGMTFDTQSHYATLNANLGGEGAVAKIGAGTLTVASNQTATAALNVNAGTLAVNGGVSVSRPITIASGATLTVNATDTATIDALALEAGSTLNIASYDGTTPFAVATSATLPAEGTVNLTLNGGAFPVGIYAIYSKSGVVAADGEKFAPSTGELGYSWSLVDSALVLTVGYVDPNAWTGLAGDSRMSSPGNWAGNAVPAAGADIDLSGISADTTIIADANRTFGAVTMGTGVVTFTNAFAATSFSDTTKVAVGADSTVTLVGDLVFATNVTACVCHSIAAGGMFAVTGDIIASAEHTGYVIPCIGQDSIPGTISCKGIVNNAYNQDYFYIVRAKSNTLANWLVGEDGISGTSRFFIQRSNYRNSYANIRAQADFTVSADIRQGFNLTLDTAGYTITLGTNTTTKSGGILGGAAGGMTTVTGAGRVVVNYNVNDLTTAASSRTNAFTVANGGTLAFTPGGNIGFGALTVQDGGTLEIQSGTTTFGNLTVEENAILGFNFTDRRNAPVLALYDGAEVNAPDPFTVKVSGTVWPSGGEKQLTTCGGFDGISLTLSAVGEAARWAKQENLSFNADGDIVLNVRPMGTIILFK